MASPLPRNRLQIQTFRSQLHPTVREQVYALRKFVCPSLLSSFFLGAIGPWHSLNVKWLLAIRYTDRKRLGIAGRMGS